MTYKMKDPDAVLDYSVNWAQWLDTDEIITSQSVSVSPVTDTRPMQVDRSELDSTGTIVVAWVSGGETGQRYRLTFQITTDAGRTDERSMNINVLER